MVGTASNIINTAGQAYSDFQRGREARIGQYQGHENIKKIGHYNAKTGKKLAIYHG